MGLIKNLGVGKNVTSQERFCTTCNNSGRIKIVQECDREKFDREFDRLDALGTMEMCLIYDKAIEGCKFDYYYCPNCEEGQQYKDQYPKYVDCSTYIKERDELYNELLERRIRLKEAEEKEIQIMKSYSKEKYRELREAEKEVNMKSKEYVVAREHFMDFAKATY